MSRERMGSIVGGTVTAAALAFFAISYEPTYETYAVSKFEPPYELPKFEDVCARLVIPEGDIRPEAIGEFAHACVIMGMSHRSPQSEARP